MQAQAAADAPLSAAPAAYASLLALYPLEDQGRGRETIFKTVEEQPMTYGLLLSAESARYPVAHANDAHERIERAVRWLLDNDDLDRDGKPGWGLPQPWDAFSDGTINPPNQPYTITTAIVLNGLLDVLKLDALPPDAREQAKKVMTQVARRWCREMWSEGFGGGFFWYSPNPADAIFADNSPSMMMGSLARLLREAGDLLSPGDRDLVQSRVDAQARALVSAVELRDGLPFWSYMPLPNKFNRSTPNDVLHHVYTLWGIEQYRDTGGRVKLTWTREQALQSFDTFWEKDMICELPQFSSLAATHPTDDRSPAVLWGAGSLLAAYAQWGNHARAARALDAIRRDYGPWPHLRVRPAPQTTTTAPESPFYARQAAHVLWGMSLYTFGSIR
jgi:hypothetical protein